MFASRDRKVNDVVEYLNLFHLSLRDMRHEHRVSTQQWKV